MLFSIKQKTRRECVVRGEGKDIVLLEQLTIDRPFISIERENIPALIRALEAFRPSAEARLVHGDAR